MVDHTEKHALTPAAIANLQRIEGNPFDAEDEALFAMFEREGWSADRRRAYIIDQARQLAATKAKVPEPTR